ncbi:MAG: ABC transporter substrate-binding protein [Candidatus Margulisbacteria bacterium]|nr:ABC transporter substrate-binding protein [Candidatus Margulisiibacteriota bacterium]
MKKITIVLILSSLLIIAGCSGRSRQTLKIGFCGPLTGDSANYGKMMTQAIKIAVVEKNSTGGIGGKVPVELIAEDDEGKVEKANAAIEKLAGIDKIYGLVGAVFSSCSLAIAPKAQANKIVMISPSSTHKDLTQMGNFIFRDVLSDRLQAMIFAKYAYEVMGLKNVAILHLKNDYSQGLAEDFLRQFEADGGKVVAIESAMQGDKNFKTQLTKIRGKQPDALFLPDYIAEIAQILEQSKQLGLSVNVLSADGFSNPEIFDLAGNLTNGVVFSNSPDESSITNNIRTDFENVYEKTYGQKPDAFSLDSYDAAKIIINALEKVYAESSAKEKRTLMLNREKIRDYVAKTANYPGVSGTITFLSNGDALKNVGIFTVNNKQYKQVGIFKTENGKLIQVQ